MYGIGLDIGGTKCAVTLGEIDEGIRIIKKEVFPTQGLKPQEVLERFCEIIKKYIKDHSIEGIGISCGGPLDAKDGIILSPPNLIGWDYIEIKSFFELKFNVPVFLQNDANACAVAEWKFGAGKGLNNIVFLTFGTGFGAGLILNGKLYSGSNDNAGEIGHIRLTNNGPLGYHKHGSAEGYCSGAGIRNLALLRAHQRNKKGENPLSVFGDIENVNARTIAEQARNGNEFCIQIYRESGRALGKVLSFIMDILNPEAIVIGGVFMRSHDLLLPTAEKVIKKEALQHTQSVCRILPAGLGEQVGDYAALALAKGDF